MLNERSTNNNSRCQHVQHVHCMLIASSTILFGHKLSPAKRDVPDTDSLRSYC